MKPGDKIEARRAKGKWEPATLLAEPVLGKYEVRFLSDGAEWVLPKGRVREVKRPKPMKARRKAPDPWLAGIMGDGLAGEDGDLSAVEVAEPVRVTTQAGLRRVDKPRARVYCEEYLAFVREQPCCACYCTGPIEAHHFGKRAAGRKTHDFNAAPCCGDCHHQFHATGTFKGMDRIETERAIYKANRDALTAWLIELLDRKGGEQRRVESIAEEPIGPERAPMGHDTTEST